MSFVTLVCVVFLYLHSSSSACRIGKSENTEELNYPEFIEFLGLLAYTLGDADTQLSAPKAGLAGITRPDGSAPRLSMLAKLHLFFYNAAQAGARFNTPEGAKMARAASTFVHAQVAQAQAEADKTKAASSATNMRRIEGVLMARTFA